MEEPVNPPEHGSTAGGTVHSPPNFAATEQPSYARILFIGPEGLRAGWGLALYFVMFYVLQTLISDWGLSWHLGRLRAEMAAEFGSLVAAVIPALVLAKIERRRWDVYGLPWRGAMGKLFWIGTVWGFCGISLLIGALYGFHQFEFGHLALHGVRILKFGGFWAAMFLLVGLFEEFALRGYSQFTLARGIGFWPAAVVLSAVFGLMHRNNAGERWLGLLAAAAIGFFFCFTLRRTGNLWFAVGFHAAWDWGETFFYSVPDSGTVEPGHLLSSSLGGNAWLSGGTVGPEGSVLCFGVIAALWIVFDRVYPAKGRQA
jgi:membrane protease YdiL (CAAX protease family)